jgi:hypothetical protein
MNLCGVLKKHESVFLMEFRNLIVVSDNYPGAMVRTNSLDHASWMGLTTCIETLKWGLTVYESRGVVGAIFMVKYRHV